MNPENGKKTYESIEIPKNLNETVMQTIASKNKEELKMKYESNENKKASEAKKSYRPVWRGCVAAAAAVLDKYSPDASKNPQMKLVGGLTLRKLASFPQSAFLKPHLDDLDKELQAIE